MFVQGFGDRLLLEFKKMSPKDAQIKVMKCDLVKNEDVNLLSIRYQHLKSDCILLGLVVPFWQLSIHSRRCGFRKENMMRKDNVQFIGKHSS